MSNEEKPQTVINVNKKKAFKNVSVIYKPKKSKEPFAGSDYIAERDKIMGWHKL